MTSAAGVRAELVQAILTFLGHQDLLSLDEVRRALEEELDDSGPDALLALRDRLRADHGWTYHAPDLLAQRIHQRLAARFLLPSSETRGLEELPPLGRVPLVICANHLSYADANVIALMLGRAGSTDLADRLTVLAGPKVFSSRQRRFSSLCFGTVKVPQSAEVSTDEAVLSPRDVARAARQSIGAAFERLQAGDALLLFPEGTRSRTGGMTRTLPAVARYLEQPGTLVLPIGIAGTEELFPAATDAVQPARVVLSIGRPLAAQQLLDGGHGDRRHVMDAIGRAIAAQVPEAYRGHYMSTG